MASSWLVGGWNERSMCGIFKSVFRADLIWRWLKRRWKKKRDSIDGIKEAAAD